MALRYHSTKYARLLKPGESFYAPPDYKTWGPVIKVETDSTGIIVRVYVENRSKPIVFNDTDRVTVDERKA